MGLWEGLLKWLGGPQCKYDRLSATCFHSKRLRMDAFLFLCLGYLFSSNRCSQTSTNINNVHKIHGLPPSSLSPSRWFCFKSKDIGGGSEYIGFQVRFPLFSHPPSPDPFLASPFALNCILLPIYSVTSTYRSLGCSLKILSERDRASRGLSDTLADTKFAVLGAPVKFPNARRGKGKGRGK